MSACVCACVRVYVCTRVRFIGHVIGQFIVILCFLYQKSELCFKVLPRLLWNAADRASRTNLNYVSQACDLGGVPLQLYGPF